MADDEETVSFTPEDIAFVVSIGKYTFVFR
jgi:hypothetical protein